MLKIWSCTFCTHTRAMLEERNGKHRALFKPGTIATVPVFQVPTTHTHSLTLGPWLHSIQRRQLAYTVTIPAHKILWGITSLPSKEATWQHMDRLSGITLLFRWYSLHRLNYDVAELYRKWDFSFRQHCYLSPWTLPFWNPVYHHHSILSNDPISFCWKKCCPQNWHWSIAVSSRTEGRTQRS